ncbi:MAG: DNA alkylation repair protein [Fulvivirga sp.]|nr:DNA alkylation repair protein [Fulvivirga sp.]
MNYLVELQKHLAAYQNETEGQKMSAYVRNKFLFLGIKASQRKQLLSQFLKQFGYPTHHQIEDILIGLWSLPYREYQYCGMEIADKVMRNPRAEDVLIIEYLLEYKQWWDTVDFIASHLVGRLFSKEPEIKSHYFNKWLKANDIWLNRTAIIFQLFYKEKTDTAMLATAIREHAGSKEFFIQKAIGWALRQYARTNPSWVRSTLTKMELQPLSIREASKYL